MTGYRNPQKIPISVKFAWLYTVTDIYTDWNEIWRRRVHRWSTLACQIWPWSVRKIGTGAPKFQTLVKYCAVVRRFFVYNDHDEIWRRRVHYGYTVALQIWRSTVKGRRPKNSNFGQKSGFSAACCPKRWTRSSPLLLCRYLSSPAFSLSFRHTISFPTFLFPSIAFPFVPPFFSLFRSLYLLSFTLSKI